ncbi:hypothetical protein PQE70_gp066 [Bacillus phage vB_BanS_Nate]|uniref:Uncharacterized protein n=1 Tax=Bacillus phage vB_BanS_Nate TaxID=2894788 RepID=A0AAE9CE62_9CAUD|nr:hypothetical protein PQE70_gp066 [Bacillus phage vB_BanS_Nate]UGO50919.1 hypothetical protein NATE_66 [Bacillus phage vB_BanS_Nate]
MKEIITDELVEHLAVTYNNYVEFTKRVCKTDKPYTFKQFVEHHMRKRDLQIRKALKHIEAKKA